MKTTYIPAVLVLMLVLPAIAQIRGAPASVTSLGSGRGLRFGPPASVTSLGPHGFAPRGEVPDKFSNRSFSNRSPSQIGRHRAINNSVSGRDRHDPLVLYPYVPYGYSYAPYGYADGNEYAGPVPDDYEPDQVAEPDPRVPPAAPPQPDNTQQSTAAKQPSADPVQQIPVILVYRDGHEQDVMNYAIVGPTLYLLDTPVTHKIPLADLDLNATVKANDDRGIEFSVQSSASMD